MYLKSFITLCIVFSVTFCGKYYLLETEEEKHQGRKAKEITSTTPSSKKEASIMSRSKSLSKSIGKIIHLNCTSVVHSHWSRLNETRLSLVQSFIVLLRQCLLCHKEPARSKQKAPSRGLFAFQSPQQGALDATSWFFMA